MYWSTSNKQQQIRNSNRIRILKLNSRCLSLRMSCSTKMNWHHPHSPTKITKHRCPSKISNSNSSNNMWEENQDSRAVFKIMNWMRICRNSCIFNKPLRLACVFRRKCSQLNNSTKIHWVNSSNKEGNRRGLQIYSRWQKLKKKRKVRKDRIRITTASQCNEGGEREISFSGVYFTIF